VGLGSGAILGSTLGWEAPFTLWGVLNVAAVFIGLALLRGRQAPTAEPPPTVNYATILRDVRYWLVPIAIGGATFNIISNFGPILMQEGYYLTPGLSGV